MKKTEKVVFALGLAAVVGVATFEIFRRKGKEFYQGYFKGGSEKLKADTWLSKMPYTTHHIINKDGMDLCGYHVAKENAKFTFVIVHGYHGRALNMSTVARTFYEEFDCDLFLPDLRAHGNSEGELVGWGWEDKEDIKEWIQYLASKHPNRPIVLFGESMGAATVTYLACEDMPNVKAIVEDCGYSELYEEFDHQAKRIVHLPLAPFYYGINQEVQKNHDYKIKEASCIECVKKAKYPMMFVHGLEDDIVPSYMAFDLYNACTTEKQLFVVKEARHTECIKLDREGYVATLREFLEEHL